MDTTQTQWVIKLFIFGLLNVERSLVYTYPHSALRDYVCVYFELWLRYDFSWFEATLEYGRAPASESCG